MTIELIKQLLDACYLAKPVSSTHLLKATSISSALTQEMQPTTA